MRWRRSAPAHSTTHRQTGPLDQLRALVKSALNVTEVARQETPQHILLGDLPAIQLARAT